MIHLGYEIATGKAVSIPLAHMAVTGQTQQSGKTTTLEALIDRSGVRAVVFVTKPGEKSFTEGRRILPYFKERADWEYVRDLLESRTGQRLSGQIGYLMRACKGAKTLQDVRENVDSELGKRDKDLKRRKAHTSRPSVNEVLAGYIDLILLELKRVPYTDKLEIERGVNIMDLSGIDENIQDMIIRSVVDRIHHHEKNTVVVVPEAWKIIPEGGRSLVFEALHGLIREGATNGNFVWIDAQDLAIVNKRILKSVTVWILGKQQEANEVVRTIRHLIAPVNIQPDQIKTLGIGEFLACFDTATRRVYVQPRWLGELDAIAIAKREETIDTAARIFREKKCHGEIKGVRDAAPQVVVNVTVPARALVAAAAQIAPPPPRQLQILDQELPDEQETKAPPPQSDGGPVVRHSERTPSPERGDDSSSEGGRAHAGVHDIESGEDEAMWKEKFEALQLENVHLRQVIADRGRATPNGDAHVPIKGNVHANSLSLYDIYQFVKQRASVDPGILQLLVARPELRVRVEPKVLEVDEDTPCGQVAKLIHEGFFAEPRTGHAVWELVCVKRRFKSAKGSIYNALEDVANKGFLVKEKSGFTATELKVTVSK